MTSKVAGLVEGLRAHALGLPETWEDDPWGELVIKVRKKIFVFLGEEPEYATHVGFSLKLPETGADLLGRGFAEPTGYGLGKSGWVSVRFEPGREPPLDEMCAWIDESYRAIAPKTLGRMVPDP